MVTAGAGGDGVLREQSEAQTGAGRQRKDPVGPRTQQVSTFDPPKAENELYPLDDYGGDEKRLLAFRRMRIAC